MGIGPSPPEGRSPEGGERPIPIPRHAVKLRKIVCQRNLSLFNHDKTHKTKKFDGFQVFVTQLDWISSRKWWQLGVWREGQINRITLALIGWLCRVTQFVSRSFGRHDLIFSIRCQVKQWHFIFFILPPWCQNQVKVIHIYPDPISAARAFWLVLSQVEWLNTW